MITIYGVSASRAIRSLWAIEETGVAYEHVATHYFNDSKTKEYQAVNPNGRIPALVDDETALFESMAINLYLTKHCLLYTSPSPRDLSTSRMPSSA